MIRIAVLDDYQHAARTAANWGSIPGEVEIEFFDRHLGFEEEAVAAALEGFEVIIAMRERTPLPATLLARLPALRLIVTTGSRNAAIDMQAARARGVPVCGTAMMPYAAAELAWALILGLAKNVSREDRAMHEGGWQIAVGIGLAGRTLGVLGLGRLGERVAAVGRAFGMQIVAWSENLTEERARACGATLVDKDALFRASDVLTIHLVLSERTRGLVGARELSLMKPGAYLVNTSRGPIVDEDALIDALERRAIAGAGLDVFDIEPLPVHHRLRSLDNALLSGHTGYVVEEAFARAYGDALEDVKGWLAGAPVRVLNGE